MKPTILLLALLSPIIARAQTPTQPMTDKLCDQQGEIYVTEKNKDESVPDPGQSFYWSFVAARYDPHANVCYVMYHRSVRGLGTVLEQIKVDDIEGNHIAGYSGVWAPSPDGRRIYTKPSECQVNSTSCESMPEFNDPLEKFMPAFKKSAPSTPRGPVAADGLLRCSGTGNFASFRCYRFLL
jgi:hypothetical protein